jgi:hypothetical protein
VSRVNCAQYVEERRIAVDEALLVAMFRYECMGEQARVFAERGCFEPTRTKITLDVAS